MIKRLLNNVSSIISDKIKPKEVIVVSHPSSALILLRVSNQVRGLMLHAPVTDWHEGYNDALDDVLAKLEELSKADGANIKL